MYQVGHYLRHENRVIRNKVVIILWGINIYVETGLKLWKKLFTIISNLQTHYHFKLDFQKVDQNTEDKF